MYNNHYDPNQPRDKNGEWTDKINALDINDDAKKKMADNINEENKKIKETLHPEIKLYTAEEIRDLDFVLAGKPVSIAVANDLKIYAGNTAYINKQKVQLTDADLSVIKSAKEIYFLYSAKDNGAYFDSRFNTFSTSSFGHNEYEPKDIEYFKTLLTKNGIAIINKK